MANEPGPTTDPTKGPGASAKQEAPPLSGPAEVTDDSGDQILVVSSPAHLDGFTIPAEGDEAEVTFDRENGTEVPADKVSDYKKRAKAAGVTLTAKKKG
jgi:hypothetical protein